MVYLRSFHLPTLYEEGKGREVYPGYPYGIFPFKELFEITFAPITIFYGGNGSGKSTLLNIISEKLSIARDTLYNYSSEFNGYLDKCTYLTADDDDGIALDIPQGSRVITSDSIFEHIIGVRRDNKRIDNQKKMREEEYARIKFAPTVKMNSLDDYEAIKLQNETRKRSRAQYVRSRTDDNIQMMSNGETALSYFNEQFVTGNLYILDEPENSLSAEFQIKLAELIHDCARFCSCQFIMVSHSPFLLSMDGAKIYDLDAVPSRSKRWYELENIKAYYKLFSENKDKFI